MVIGFGHVELLMILKRVKRMVEKQPDWHAFKETMGGKKLGTVSRDNSFQNVVEREAED